MVVNMKNITIILNIILNLNSKMHKGSVEKRTINISKNNNYDLYSQIVLFQYRKINFFE